MEVMSESRDPAIKLFGKMIPLRANREILAVAGEEGGGEEDKDLLNKEATTESKDKDHESSPSMASEAQKPSNDDQETATAKNSKPEDEQNSTSNSQEKTLKKPDKVLPCPRCNSLDTKFCYYNNYNVNQPRHFCKKCQRYWTAGGTMRNVPVGAGRRKNKSCASHYRRITVSNSALQTVRSYVPEQIHHPPLQPNCSTVLNFGSDTPLYESMASVLSLAEKTIGNSNQNECYQEEEKKVSFSCGVENGDDQSSGSTVTASSNSCTEGAGANLQDPGIWNGQGFPQIPCFNGSLWPYQWSPAPAFCTSSFPVSFYPTPYWGCTVPGNGSIPWISPLASTSPNCGSSAGSNSPTLGKHSREGNLLKHSNSEKRDDLKHTNQEKCLWIPKTLRIDDPEEAAKSSIWATIGIKNDKAGAFSGGGLFKAFQPKAVTKNHSVETSQVLLANPAALSRSLNFQERS